MRACDRPRCSARTSAGFAYLWVLLLVAFMGLGLTMGAEIFVTSVQRDRERELLAIGRQFRTAIGRYHDMQLQNGKGEYPAALEDLLQDKRSAGVRRHLRKIFVDPMTGKAEWGLVRLNGRIVGLHSLSERTPIKQAGFDAEDAAFQGRQQYSAWVFTYPSNLLLVATGATDDTVPPTAPGKPAEGALAPAGTAPWSGDELER